MKKILLFLGLFITLLFLVKTTALACDYNRGIITSITPRSVTAGETLTINGSGFDTITERLYEDGQGFMVDKRIAIFWRDNPDYRHGGMVFGRGGNGDNIIDNIISWSDTKIEINITESFESETGIQNAFIENNNRFSVYLVIYGYRHVDTLNNGREVYRDMPENNYEICGQPDNDDSSSFIYVPSCNEDTWTCGEWGTCSVNGQQTKTCTKTFDCPLADTPSPAITQSCTPVCTSWTYSNWLECTYGTTQQRSIISSYPAGCEGGLPFLYRACPPVCYSFSWSCNSWSTCSVNGTQTRTCSKVSNCEGGVSPPAINQSCVYIPPVVACTANDWSCGSWGACSSSGSQTRTCNKISSCSGGVSSPAVTQSCTYTPACSADTWQCGNWGTCSPQGIQTRSCNKTLDCPSAETASPQTSQYCQPSTQPKSQNQQYISQETIVKATVKLICPLDNSRAYQGSGTVINSDGTILTNKHVIDGTLGCWVGFIDKANDEPYFSDRHIADITRVSSDSDIATLKLRNPNKRNLTSVNIGWGNSNSLNLGQKVTTYGYPADFGEKITYTSGDFSGYNGNYLKTTAILEHGNSGGGAYLEDGTFIGIPSAVITGTLNSMGLVLSINKINSWLNNTKLSLSDSYNSYARVSSLLEDVDLNTLHLFELIESDNQVDETASKDTEVLDRERSQLSNIDSKLTNRLKGKILLQVESVGEAWYVHPDTEKKFYMKDGSTAYNMLREFGLGITDADLAKIPVGIEKRINDVDSDGDGLADRLEEGLKTDIYKADTDGDGVSDGDEVLKNNTNPLGTGKLYYSASLVNRLKGKILLQVESKGEAWYINPDDGKRYYMKNGDAAYQIMRFLSLGITNDDLRKIDIGEL